MDKIVSSVSEFIFFLCFISAVILLFFHFTKIALDGLKKHYPQKKEAVLQSQVSSYFSNRGYIVNNIISIRNSRDLFAYLWKNGEYVMVLVLIKEAYIEGYIDSLE